MRRMEEQDIANTTAYFSGIVALVVFLLQNYTTELLRMVVLSQVFVEST